MNVQKFGVRKLVRKTLSSKRKKSCRLYLAHINCLMVDLLVQGIKQEGLLNS